MAMSGLVPAPKICSNRPATATSVVPRAAAAGAVAWVTAAGTALWAAAGLAPPGQLPGLGHLRGRPGDRLPSLGQMVEVLADPEHAGAVVRGRVAPAGHALRVGRPVRDGQYRGRWRLAAGRPDLGGEAVVEAGQVRGLPAKRGQFRVGPRAVPPQVPLPGRVTVRGSGWPGRSRPVEPGGGPPPAPQGVEGQPFGTLLGQV